MSVVHGWSRAPTQWMWWSALTLSITDHHKKFHQDPSICSRVKFQTIFFFYINAYMTLTFDLVTLTFGQLQDLINTNHICKYHYNQSIRSGFIGENYSMLTDTHTYTHTYTDSTAYRVPLQLHWTGLKICIVKTQPKFEWNAIIITLIFSHIKFMSRTCNLTPPQWRQINCGKT